jgi:hypothetical protein
LRLPKLPPFSQLCVVSPLRLPKLPPFGHLCVVSPLQLLKLPPFGHLCVVSLCHSFCCGNVWWAHQASWGLSFTTRPSEQLQLVPKLQKKREQVFAVCGWVCGSGSGGDGASVELRAGRCHAQLTSAFVLSRHFVLFWICS